MSRQKDNKTKRQKDKKNKKRQKDKKTKKTKRQKDKETKKTKRQKGKKTKKQKDKRQTPKREFNILTSGQFRTLAMFFQKKLHNLRDCFSILWVEFTQNSPCCIPSGKKVCCLEKSLMMLELNLSRLPYRPRVPLFQQSGWPNQF